MKKILSTMMVFSLMVALFSFTACSDDDKDEGSLIGTWKCVISDQHVEADEVKTTNYLQFKDNGTYISVTVYEFNIMELGPNTRNEWTVQHGNWRIADNIMHTVMDGEVDEVSFKISGNKLSISSKTGYFSSLTYTRVSDSEIDPYLKKR